MAARFHAAGGRGAVRGQYLPRRLALAIPLGILLLSDAIIDAHYGARFFSPGTFANYALLAVVGLAG